ncbi:MAG: YdeI/OmpD-associated family protein [Candidatus Thiodiazotropha sp. (ex Clathrolucina costata)]|nr:YdeI/OmpD-associated family protein [Candidatus Thiodiazotropha taylori]
MAIDFSKLKRDRHPMPSFVKEALEDNAIMQDYLERPAYQQNDYIGWINQAKQEETKQKRLNQMLAELKQGGVYMKMAHSASAKK